MTKRLTSKYKTDRAQGINLWGRPKSPVNKRSYGPGQHGPTKRPGGKTDYAKQLLAKQRLKKYYANISEKQFHKYYLEASRQKADTAQTLIGLLETRLDAIIYRAKFVKTVFAARQFVNHGHVLVNGKRVNIPSYLVRVGDVITVREKSKTMSAIAEAIASTEREVPDYVSVDSGKLAITFVRIPAFEDVPYPVEMNPNLIIEFYSRQ
jgi:small subunit ribosomal protein S4